MYRIKHKETGLYYQPSKNGNNLGKNGKVYTTKICPLTINRGSSSIPMYLKEDSIVYKQFIHLLKKYNPTKSGYLYNTYHFLIPKEDFEIENI